MVKNYPGTLILVVGNSGSGKDSIINGASEKYPLDLKKVYCAKRYITRPPSETEDNYYISSEEYNEMRKQGKFALEWQIYGLDYGVPIEIDNWLKNGYTVIVNVSRTIINNTRKKYTNVKVVFIEVPFDITLLRLKNRERESEQRMKERIERARNNQKYPEADFVVDNSGELDDAINQFLNYVISIVKDK
ncbi:MAG: phosphonate metabolism protein/1,5-bisphosphokinase (PRPP-forming) PhnN [Candidatus Hodarchaeota archaeon]